VFQVLDVWHSHIAELSLTLTIGPFPQYQPNPISTRFLPDPAALLAISAGPRIMAGRAPLWLSAIVISVNLGVSPHLYLDPRQ
jgi:hypothetical protein